MGSFPGGRQDETDRDEVECALRETEEELGLDRKHLRHNGDFKLGVNLQFTWYRRILVTPLVFELDQDVADRLPAARLEMRKVADIINVGPDEVDFAFHAPVSDFRCPGMEQFWLYNYHTTMVEMKPSGDEIRVGATR